jgi:hypothetical protein
MVFWISAALSLAIYILISYRIPRHETMPLLICYFFLFVAYLLLYHFSDKARFIDQAYLVGFLFRLSLLFLIPNLSDDVYRFLWDGHLTANGLSPYAHLPDHFLSDPDFEKFGLTPSLFDLFSKNTHSSYPPLDQVIFALAVVLSPHSRFGSILVIRIFILLFETGTIMLIRTLLKSAEKPTHLGLLYVLNPLVILELTGYLHFEGIMIFFLLWSLWFIYQSKFISAGATLGLSILTKLIPLIFLPFLWIRYGNKKGTKMVISTIIIIILGFLPFVQINSMGGFLSSLALYFNKLEFNASIYFLIRQIGYWITGYNIIFIAGPVLGLITFMLIVWLSSSSWTKVRKEEEIWMWILMIYLAMTTTLHPWYIITLLVLSIFTRYRFPVVWTFLIFFTYQGYSETGFSPNYWLIGMEYLVVYGIMIWEIRSISLKNQVH